MDTEESLEELVRKLNIDFLNPNIPQDSDENNDSGGKKKKKTQAQILVELALRAQLFHDTTDEAYAVIPIGDHNEIQRLHSKFFKSWLAELFYDEIGAVPSREALTTALTILEGKALHDRPERKLYNRAAYYQGSIWYDLTNVNWQVVRIKEDGWEVVSNPPILFKRFAHQASQDIPIKGGDIKKILEFVNLKPEQELMFLVYIVSCFIPDIPHPIITFYGEKGAAKTTTMKMLKRLVDPSQIETLSFPRDKNEFVQQLSHHWFTGFDNISYLPDWISDDLCKAVTGDGFSKRQLYSDDDDVIYNFKRCISLNGINVVATREDLLDRCILIGLERITPEERKEEAELWRDFDKVRPYILGGAFDILSKAMVIYPKVKLKQLFRMADFTRWGYAIAEALGGKGEKFLKQYSSNIKQQNEEAILANPVASAVVKFMADRNGEEWVGKPSELLGELERVAEKEKINTHSKAWPKAANALTKALNKIKSNLADASINYTHGGRNEGGSVITLKGTENTYITYRPTGTPVNKAFPGDKTNVGKNDKPTSSTSLPTSSKPLYINDNVGNVDNVGKTHTLACDTYKDDNSEDREVVDL